jgi:hypothetical protein
MWRDDLRMSVPTFRSNSLSSVFRAGIAVKHRRPSNKLHGVITQNAVILGWFLTF